MMPACDLTTVQAALTVILSYLLGSVPFGIVAAYVFGLGNLRKIGSGNIGATNVLRTGHKLGAAFTLLGDIGKGALAVVIARMLLGEFGAQLAALCAFLGHCFPIYLRFIGGKGVATFFGILLALSWPVGLACGAIWLGAAAFFRISSLAALIAAGSGPIWALVLGWRDGMVLLFILAALIFWRHRSNIIRLLNGDEPRIGEKT